MASAVTKESVEWKVVQAVVVFSALRTERYRCGLERIDVKLMMKRRQWTGEPLASGPEGICDGPGDWKRRRVAEGDRKA